MEKVKEKLNELRKQIEDARALEEEYKAKIKQLEQDHTSKDHELISLRNRGKLLEESLENSEKKLQVALADSQNSEKRAEDAERRVQSLEEQLSEQEGKHEKLLEQYNGARNELDELARQFEEL